MTPLERIANMKVAAQELNMEVRQSLDTITLLESRKMITVLLDIEGWLQGIREILLDPTAPTAKPYPTDPSAVGHLLPTDAAGHFLYAPDPAAEAERRKT